MSYKALNFNYISNFNKNLLSEDIYKEALKNIKNKHKISINNFNERINNLEDKLKDKEHMISMSCRICYTNKIDIIVIPCNHLIMCKTCLDTLFNIETPNFQCPLCQTNIDDFKVAYLPE